MGQVETHEMCRYNHCYPFLTLRLVFWGRNAVKVHANTKLLSAGLQCFNLSHDSGTNLFLTRLE